MTQKLIKISKLHNNELCFKLKRYGYSNVASFLERYWLGIYENDDWLASSKAMTEEEIKENAKGDAGGLGYAVRRNEFCGTDKEYIDYLNAYINCCNYYEYDNADYDEVVQKISQFKE